MQIANMMEVDGVPVKIEGERNLLEVISKTGVKSLKSRRNAASTSCCTPPVTMCATSPPTGVVG